MLVYAWMYAQDARISISSTFQEMYEQAVRVYAQDEALWIESSNGVMDIPYTLEQLGEMFVEQSPPPSLNWLLKLGSSFCAIEYDEHNGREDWTFEFEHFHATFFPKSSQWELQIVKTGKEWCKPIKLPYKYDKKLSALVVSHYIENNLKGFAESWLLPLQDIKEYWCRDDCKDISKGSIIVISQLDYWKEEREAKINAGYHTAEYLCYY
ncbi:hypothetical protein cce_5099 [Crocosphaera subtropica ATCC 51142]|uniref:Uncharacterized protein n=1 Tax=Crocosphaera subtropica (strain ATCC 51142 / BH68) TaxID=43989 RepID=B1X2T4_CROS5|nr:hypothetical protein [Crocosphaera subtropica]ACB54445.1 hypothetical protein cce_5099 [Crocosphaera subtropica ATCC 51142]